MEKIVYGTLYDEISELKDKNGHSIIDTVEPVTGSFIPKEYYDDGFPKSYFQSDIILVDKVKGKIIGTIEVDGSLYHDPDYIRSIWERAQPPQRKEMTEFFRSQLNSANRLVGCPESLSNAILGGRSYKEATVEDYIKKVMIMNSESYDKKK